MQRLGMLLMFLYIDYMLTTTQLQSWEVIAAFNVFIELLLFALPVWLVWNLKTELSKRVTVVAVFGLRLP